MKPTLSILTVLLSCQFAMAGTFWSVDLSCESKGEITKVFMRVNANAHQSALRERTSEKYASLDYGIEVNGQYCNLNSKDISYKAFEVLTQKGQNQMYTFSASLDCYGMSLPGNKLEAILNLDSSQRTLSVNYVKDGTLKGETLSCKSAPLQERAKEALKFEFGS